MKNNKLAKTKVADTLKKPAWTIGLTKKNRQFILEYGDGISKNYSSLVSSFLAAGYTSKMSDGLNRQAAITLYNKPKIQKSLLLYNRHLWDKLEVNRGFTLQRLCDTYDRAVQGNDGATQLGCVKLMMQYNNMLTVNLNISSDYSKTYDATKEQEIKILASMRIQGILNASGQIPLTMPPAALNASIPAIVPPIDDNAIDALFSDSSDNSAADDDDSSDDDDSVDS